jgi:hypothetical protein
MGDPWNNEENVEVAWRIKGRRESEQVVVLSAEGRR